MQLSEEHRMIRQMVREFALGEVKPCAKELDETGEVNWDLYKKMGELGLLGMPFPEEWGGGDTDTLGYTIGVEEISRVCGSTGLSMAAHTSLGTYPIYTFGTEEQKKKYVPDLASGKKFGGFGLTEPGAGSDAGGTQTTAVRDGDHYVLNGTKCFISLGGVADLYGVFASTCPHKKTKGLSAFIVLRETNGLSVGKIENPMGMRGAAGAEIIFEDAKVPKENLLGKEGDGFMILVNSLNVERLWFASMALGTSQGALDYAVQYAKQRVQFGRPIAEFQGIQFMLADMAIQIEVGRSILYDAASEIDRGIKNDGSKSAIAKCFITDTAMKVTTDAVQILGGYGYIKEYPVERMMRDAKATQIAAGTNQIQRVLIARSLLRK